MAKRSYSPTLCAKRNWSPRVALGVSLGRSGANPTYTADELKHEFSDTGSKALVRHTSLLDTLIAAAKRVTSLVCHH